MMKLELILVDRAVFQSAMISDFWFKISLQILVTEVVHCPLDLFFLLATFEPLRSKSEMFFFASTPQKGWIKVSCFSETINWETQFYTEIQNEVDVFKLLPAFYPLNSPRHKAPALTTERPTCHGADHPAVHTEGHFFCSFRKCLHWTSRFRNTWNHLQEDNTYPFHYLDFCQNMN